MLSDDSIKLFKHLEYKYHYSELYSYFYNNIIQNNDIIKNSIKKHFKILNSFPVIKKIINKKIINNETKDDFFYTSYIKNYNNKLSFSEFSNKYNDDCFFKNHIHKSNLNINYDNINDLDDTSYSKTLINYLNEIKNLDFISLDIKNYIYQKVNTINIIKFDYITILLFYNNNEFNDELVNTIINNVINIVHWIANLQNNNKTIKLNISLNNIKRLINFNDKILTPKNINGGSSQSEYILNIWRYEEIYKVLIHELIHYYYLDIRNDYEFCNSLQINFGCNNYPIILNEAITEIQAQYLNIIFILFKLNFDKNNNIDELNNMFNLLYSYELYFSWIQLMKICKFYKINILEQLLSKNTFNQTTNIFSYFILKSLYNINCFDILKELPHLFLTYDNISKNICNNYKCTPITNKTKNILNEINKKFFIDNYINYDILINENNLRMTLWSLI